MAIQGPSQGDDASELPPSFPPEPLNEADIRRPSPKDPIRNPRKDSDEESEDELQAEEPKASWLRNLLEFVAIIAVALLISVLIKTFVMQAYYVPSGSMEQTLQKGDRIAVNRTARDAEDINRGDIVVFVDPGGWLEDQPDTRNGLQRFSSDVFQAIGLLPQNSGHHLVKRVIGIGGDEVECCTDRGLLTVNGEPIEEDYLAPDIAPSLQEFSVEVPEDSLWVMGDNRSNSSDSRYHQLVDGNGFVPVDNVEGRVWSIFYPFSRFGGIPQTDSFDSVD
ncbi:MAG: signal peptidase I [Ancrocorticia sp.]|uniref:signal peptidase I n=1 Tax=Ancrocorticia sp. TaxID=2593684 RepID=UPI003F921241